MPQKVKKTCHEDMFADPVPEPYPEMQEEMYDLYRSLGHKPEDLLDLGEREGYIRWLKAHPDSGT